METAGSLVVAIVGWLVLLWASPAQAHTDMVGSSPGAGETVPLVRDHLILEFEDELRSGSDVVVRGPDGTDVTRGEAGILGAALDVRLSLEEPGVHTVSYRVVGHDGHPQVGSFRFTVVAEDVLLAQGLPRGGATVGSPGAVGTPGSPGSPGAPSWLVPTLGLVGVLLLLHTVAGAPARRRRPDSPST